MIYVGVDPGARWTGIATVEVRGRRMRLRSYVVDGEKDLYDPVSFVLRRIGTRPAELAMENYLVRPVGHQAWSGAETARVIGALEWAAREAGWPTFYYAPGNAREHLEGLKVGRILREWAEGWPPSKAWDHAWSAWRVLTIHLLREQPTWLSAMRELRQRRSVPARPRTGALVAPALLGTVPADWS